MESERAERQWWNTLSCPNATEEDRRNQNRFALWTFAWAVTFVGALFVLASTEMTGPAAAAVALVPTVMGAAAVWAYWSFIRSADELLRKIHLESLALGFGAGTIFMLSYSLFERAGAPVLDVSDPLLVMFLVWTVAQLVLSRRYM